MGMGVKFCSIHGCAPPQDMMRRTDDWPGNLCEAPCFPVILLYLMGKAKSNYQAYKRL